MGLRAGLMENKENRSYGTAAATLAIPGLLFFVNLLMPGKDVFGAETTRTPAGKPPSYTEVTYGPPATGKFTVEMITDTGGRQKGDGTGRSCWGFNQSNIVRHGKELYAMCWRDDTHLTVFRRKKEGEWEASPLLPKVPQNGVLLVDSTGRVHVVAGAQASYHAYFDPPGDVRKFEIRAMKPAGSRFGAAIRADNDILVVGAAGQSAMGWYVLKAKENFRQAFSGRMPFRTWRAYYFVAFQGTAGYAFCHEIAPVAGVYHQLHTYLYYAHDVIGKPDNWKKTVVSDISHTLEARKRGATEDEDLLIDQQGRVHVLYFWNPMPTTSVFALQLQDRAKDQLYHAVGPPTGPFKHYYLGNFWRGRIHQTSDGRFHYFLLRGEKYGQNDLWYATGENGKWDTMSKPIQLKTPGKIDHIFLNNTRAGGTLETFVDCYFTGQYPGKNGDIYYGRLELAR